MIIEELPNNDGKNSQEVHPTLAAQQSLPIPGYPDFEKFRNLFKKFARVGDERKNGLMMTRLNCFRWLRQAGIYGGLLDSRTVQTCFKKIASPMTAVNMKEFQDFLQLMASRSSACAPSGLLDKLVACGCPDPTRFRQQIGSDGDKASPQKHCLQTSLEGTSKRARLRHEMFRQREESYAELFKAYSMLDRRYSNGLVISRKNVMYWFRKADILDKEISEEDFCDFFRCVVNAHLVMDSKELRILIAHVARRITRKPEDVLTMLLRCGNPDPLKFKDIARTRRDPSDLFRIPKRYSSTPIPTSFGDHRVSDSFASRNARFELRKGKALNFDDLFKLYGKLNDPSKTGVIITRFNTLVWFEQAGLLEERNSHFCVMECFHQVTRTQTVMNKTEFEKFIDAVSVKLFRSTEDILKKLVACGAPDLHQFKQKRSDLIKTTSSFRDVRLPVSMDCTVRFIQLPKYTISGHHLHFSTPTFTRTTRT